MGGIKRLGFAFMGIAMEVGEIRPLAPISMIQVNTWYGELAP
jgi:hypothetical protein